MEKVKLYFFGSICSHKPSVFSNPCLQLIPAGLQMPLPDGQKLCSSSKSIRWSIFEEVLGHLHKKKKKIPSLAFRTGRNQMCLVGEHVWTATTEHTCRIYFWVPRYGFLYLTWPSFGRSAFSITEINTKNKAPPWPLAFHFLKSIQWHFWPSRSSCFCRLSKLPCEVRLSALQGKAM